MRFAHRVNKEGPLEADAQETQQATPAETALDYETMDGDLRAAREAEGEDEVADALHQVDIGEARPEELLAWFDEIRENEHRDDHEPDGQPPLGFMHDFELDSEVGDSNIAAPDAVDDAAQAAAPRDPSFDDSADGDYVFSAVRRRNAGLGDDGEDAGDGSDGDASKAEQPTPKTKSTKDSKKS